MSARKTTPQVRWIYSLCCLHLQLILGVFGGAAVGVEPTPDLQLGLHSMSQPPPPGINDHNFGGSFNLYQGRANTFRRGEFGKIECF